MTDYECCKACPYNPKTCRLLKEPILCGPVLREQHFRIAQEKQEKQCDTKPAK